MIIIPPGSTIGIIGGGQLGRMTALAAANLGYKVHIYTDQENSPASHVADRTTTASYENKEKLAEFAQRVDIVTFEFENIPHNSVKILEESVPVRPSWKVLHISQNRLREKDFINASGVGTAPYYSVGSADELTEAFRKIDGPCILKTVEMGYDGKGQFGVDEYMNIEALWKEAGIGLGILEGKVDFEKEISVIIARNEHGAVIPYPAVENIHKGGILDTTIAPAVVHENVASLARDIAIRLAQSIELVGIMAIEMFVTRHGDVLVNELAPRPHNSGHWTMDACYTSQFEQFIRAICGLPFGSVEQHSKARMKNLIGKEVEQWEKYLNDPKAKLHLYGKGEAREGRKMGHVTMVGR